MIAEDQQSMIEKLCGPHADLMERYVRALLDRAQPMGYIGPAEKDVIWPRHVANCATLSSLLPPNATVCDVGSGAGLPGIVLAILRPDLKVTCLESMRKRCEFLLEVIDGLGLTQVNVVNIHTNDFHPPPFDYVTARAVAPLPKLIKSTLHLIKPQGSLLALKGSSVKKEINDVSVDKSLSRRGTCRLHVVPDIYGQDCLVVQFLHSKVGSSTR